MSFDQHRFSYDSQINSAIAFAGQEHEFYLKVKADILINLLRRQRSREPLAVLDVGCGNGTMHPFLLSSGLPIQLTGIEVAPQFLALARDANPGVEYEVYEGGQLPYGADQFDAAIAVCVMHHVPPPRRERFISEMTRVVKPGGLVAIFEHNPLNPLTLYIVKTCPIDEDAVLLRAGQLTGLLEKAALVRVAREFFLFTPFKSNLFRRFDGLMNWFPLGAQYVAFGYKPAVKPERLPHDNHRATQRSMRWLESLGQRMGLAKQYKTGPFPRAVSAPDYRSR